MVGTAEVLKAKVMCDTVGKKHPAQYLSINVSPSFLCDGFIVTLGSPHCPKQTNKQTNIEAYQRQISFIDWADAWNFTREYCSFSPRF